MHRKRAKDNNDKKLNCKKIYKKTCFRAHIARKLSVNYLIFLSNMYVGFDSFAKIINYILISNKLLLLKTIVSKSKYSLQ